ncbi:MFS transporter [Bacillus tianshenii]|nr:MFS transporter [Bacillus tianshenii]
MQTNETVDLELDAGQKKRLIILICTILAFSVMNGTMFNVAIPDISDTFQLKPSEVSWVMTGYILIFSIGSLMYGKLADIYPIRTLLTIGIALFSTGAFIGFLSPNYGTLVVARVLQAIGGATIPALSFLIPARFLPKERGRVFGIVSSTVAFASGIGPILGGVVTSLLNWRFLFLLSVAASFAIPLFRKWLPQEEKREGKIDYIGAALLAIAVANLLFFITTFLWYTAVTSAVFMGLFVWRTISVDEPFIQPEILKNIRYSTTVFTSFLSIAVLFGLIFVIPIMLADLYGFTAFQIGLVLFPGAMTSAFIGQVGGKIIDEKGGVPVVKAALMLIGTGTILISTFAGASAWVIATCLLISYLGFPLIQSSTADLLSSVLPDKQNGVGIGLFNLLNFLAGALSSAILGKVLDSKSVEISLNPLSASGENVIYSNVFLILTTIAVIALTTFTIMFIKTERKHNQVQNNFS